MLFQDTTTQGPWVCTPCIYTVLNWYMCIVPFLIGTCICNPTLDVISWLSPPSACGQYLYIGCLLGWVPLQVHAPLLSIDYYLEVERPRHLPYVSENLTFLPSSQKSVQAQDYTCPLSGQTINPHTTCKETLFGDFRDKGHVVSLIPSCYSLAWPTFLHTALIVANLQYCCTRSHGNAAAFSRTASM